MAQTAGGTYYAASSELVSSWPATSLDLANQLESRFAAKAADATQGLYFISATSFSAAASVSVNNCYSTTYNAYRIVCSAIGSTTAQAMSYRNRVGGADASGANYNRYGYYGGTGTGNVNNTSQTSFALTAVSSANRSFTVLDVMFPEAADATLLISNGYGSNGIADYNVGIHTLGTAYTGFSLFPASGTFTGNVRVYGYKN